MAKDDWPPRGSATMRVDGFRKRGSTGQMWEVRQGQWFRVNDPEKGRLVPLHGSGPDNQ